MSMGKVLIAECAENADGVPLFLCVEIKDGTLTVSAENHDHDRWEAKREISKELKDE
jgi:hypothetical protein